MVKQKYWQNICSRKCYEYLRSMWSEDELIEGINDPIAFVRKTINPFIRNLRKKGKTDPLIIINSLNPVYLILSSEQK